MHAPQIKPTFLSIFWLSPARKSRPRAAVPGPHVHRTAIAHGEFDLDVWFPYRSIHYQKQTKYPTRVLA